MKVKDSVPRSLCSCVVYTCMCVGCNSLYGGTCRHISTRVRELQSSNKCKDSCDESCFKGKDSAKTYHQHKVKEALQIVGRGPT